jgi:hypothetical protein
MPNRTVNIQYALRFKNDASCRAEVARAHHMVARDWPERLRDEEGTPAPCVRYEERRLVEQALERVRAGTATAADAELLGAELNTLSTAVHQAHKRLFGHWY